MNTAIGWQGMGKPDYSRVAQMLERFPAEVKNRWNMSQWNVLKRTIFYSWYTAYHSGRNSTLASFSESTLGKAFGKSRWTVMRALRKLEEYGLVKRIRRSPKKDGTFQTNLVAITAKLSAVLALTTRQPRDKSPCSKSAPQEVGNDYKRDKAASLSAPPLVPRQEDRQCLEQAKKLFAEWSLLTP